MSPLGSDGIYFTESEWLNIGISVAGGMITTITLARLAQYNRVKEHCYIKCDTTKCAKAVVKTGVEGGFLLHTYATSDFLGCIANNVATLARTCMPKINFFDSTRDWRGRPVS
ncbi:MAG: hypothetical protein S4CHLAM123_10080 [Chlamydiales bacterium]|nr:hypothetical protein [Chlamydiales bacterium]